MAAHIVCLHVSAADRLQHEETHVQDALQGGRPGRRTFVHTAFVPVLLCQRLRQAAPREKAQRLLSGRRQLKVSGDVTASSVMRVTVCLSPVDDVITPTLLL